VEYSSWRLQRSAGDASSKPWRHHHYRFVRAGGLDKLPPSINLWRCELQWLGGMGIIVLAVRSAAPRDRGASHETETPGPMKDTRLTPRHH